MKSTNYESRPVLITGGCGFIGTNLVKYLSERHCYIRILDNATSSSRIWDDCRALHSKQKTQDLNLDTLAPPFSEVDLVAGDIRDRAALDKATAGISAVIHLAALTSVVDSLEKPEESWDINVNGTLNLLESCRRNGVGKFILASSNAVLGDQIPPVDESKIAHPLSPYGASKLACEALCSTYYRSFGINTVCLRFANCYGPYSEHKSSAITMFIDWAMQGQPIIIYGDGKQTRDFVHTDDICQAIHLSLASADSIAGEILQVASGVETSVNELVEMIKEIMVNTLPPVDSQLAVIYKPRRMGEIERNYCDISKAKSMLGFRPRMKLREGLNELCQLYVAGNSQ